MGKAEGKSVEATITQLPAIAGGFLAFVLLLTVLLGQRINAVVESVERAHFPAFELALSLEADLSSINQTLKGAQASGNAAGLEVAERTKTEALQRIEKARKEAALDAAELDRLQAAFDAYYAPARLATEKLVRSEADEQLTTALDASRQNFTAAREALTAYKQSHRDVMVDGFADARSRGLQLVIVILAVTVAAVVVLFFRSRRVVADVTRPLRHAVDQAVSVAERWAQGDLTAGVSGEAVAEVKSLLDAMDKMAGNLRRMIGETQSGANNLAAAASQILASTRRTVASAQEQASAVQETTATASELQQTVRVTEERAREMQEAMSRTVGSSQAIRSQLGDATGSMGRVRQEMQHVMTSIQDLAKRNLQIGEIIESVGEVADQTQLLAINAAIEAAKAGEAGRGFGVVALEMKNLADQSKKASQRIRAIVSEVQQAASETTQVAITGQARLEDAIAPVTGVLPLVEQLTAEVEESSRSLRQILAIVGQQIVGISQISQAMKAIQGEVQEGVAQSHQLQRGAEGLDVLGAQLRDLVAGYRLN